MYKSDNCSVCNVCNGKKVTFWGMLEEKCKECDGKGFVEDKSIFDKCNEEYEELDAGKTFSKIELPNVVTKKRGRKPNAQSKRLSLQKGLKIDKIVNQVNEK